MIWLFNHDDLDLHAEYRFHPTRKWRFDFAHLETKTAIEINGGLWTKSKHSSGVGLQRDYEKSNEAILLGWQVFTLCDSTITSEWIGRISAYIRSKKVLIDMS